MFMKVEPQLKYERMTNDLASILSRDAASCLAVHSKVMYCFDVCTALKMCNAHRIKCAKICHE